MEIKALIIDDSQHDLDMIYDTFMVITNTSHCDRMKMIPSNIEQLEYDIFILDIDMPKMNGFEVARKITLHNPKAIIMFCTNHNELVFESFQFHTFYFIRKDSIQSDMLDALHKYQQDYFIKNQMYTLKSNEETNKIPFDSIIYFEVYGNQLRIKTMKNEYLERKTMKVLLNEIPGSMFFQITRSILINISFIRSISKDHVLLEDGSDLEVSRSRMKELKDAYLEFIV